MDDFSDKVFENLDFPLLTVPIKKFKKIDLLRINFSEGKYLTQYDSTLCQSENEVHRVDK
jgi:hypothetical protein